MSCQFAECVHGVLREVAYLPAGKRDSRPSEARSVGVGSAVASVMECGKDAIE